jgi:hypothetical protein
MEEETVKLLILIGLLFVLLARWHAWVGDSDEHARALIACEQRGYGWVMIDGRCIAGSQRSRP